MDDKDYTSMDAIPDPIKEKLTELGMGAEAKVPSRIVNALMNDDEMRETPAESKVNQAPEMDPDIAAYVNLENRKKPIPVATLILGPIALLSSILPALAFFNDEPPSKIMLQSIIFIGSLIATTATFVFFRRQTMLRERQIRVVRGGIPVVGKSTNIKLKSIISENGLKTYVVAIEYGYQTQDGVLRHTKTTSRLTFAEHTDLKIGQETPLMVDPKDPAFVVWPAELKSHPGFRDMAFDNMYK